MEPLSSMLAAVTATITLALGGVNVTVTGPTAVLPAQPDPAHPEVLWKTSQVAMYAQVLMDNGQRWMVKSTKRLPDQSIMVSLKPPTTTILTNVYVPVGDLEEPIWWIGEVVVNEPLPDPDPQPGEDPLPPDGPGEGGPDPETP